jgi:hypothetical protein
MGRTTPSDLPARHAANELPSVRELATNLLPAVDEIAGGMAMALHAQIPELAGDEAGPLFEESRASCRANVGQILRLLSQGDPVGVLSTPPEAIEYARSYVRRELALAVLLRAYRVGQAYFLERFTTALSARITDDPGLGEAIVATNAWVFAYVDEICNRLVTEYRTARDRWSRTPDAIRAEAVRAIIVGTLADPREASRLLGHELERRHHLGLVIWESHPNGSRRPHALGRVASVVADATGMSDLLLVPLGESELWAWLSAREQPHSELPSVMSEAGLHTGVHIATGRSAVGVDGFRSSHIEAVAAARVAVLAGDAAPPTTVYDDVELVSLLSADLERARAFVGYELGALAGTDPPIARLRETMLVLFEEGMSNSRAAQRLCVHHNTVAYRTARAKELLGHGLVERRIQLTAALMLARTLGDAVLGRDSG